MRDMHAVETRFVPMIPPDTPSALTIAKPDAAACFGMISPWSAMKQG